MSSITFPVLLQVFIILTCVVESDVIIKDMMRLNKKEGDLFIYL